MLIGTKKVPAPIKGRKSKIPIIIPYKIEQGFFKIVKPSVHMAAIIQIIINWVFIQAATTFLQSFEGKEFRP